MKQQTELNLKVAIQHNKSNASTGNSQAQLSCFFFAFFLFFFGN
jgi:hypothetical protein